MLGFRMFKKLGKASKSVKKLCLVEHIALDRRELVQIICGLVPVAIKALHCFVWMYQITCKIPL